MSYLIIVFLMMASFAFSSGLFVYAIRFRTLPAIRIFLLLMFAFAWIAVCSVAVLLHQDFEIKVIFSRLRFLAYPVISPLCLLMSIELFHFKGFLKTVWMKLIVFFVPLIVAALVLIPGMNDFMTKNYQPFSAGGITTVQFENASFFTVYYLVTVLVMVLNCAILLRMVIHGKKNQKRQAIALLSIGILGLLLDVLIVKSSNIYRWLMLPTGAHVIYEFGLTFAIFRYGLMSLVSDANFEKINSRLMSLVAHDLVSNIGAMSSLSASISKKNNQQEEMLLLGRSISGAQDFLGNLLRWLKSQSLNTEQVFSVFEIKTLIREAVEQSNLQIELKSISVEFEFDSTPILVKGDSEMIMAVVRNILSNAIRYSEFKSKIIISAELDKTHMMVTIKDHGPGMSLLQINRILGHDATLNIKSGADAGYGIGMILSREFLDLHRGHLIVKSKLGDGSAVGFSIPTECSV